MIGAVYKVLPDLHLRWRDVAVGACVTALLLSIGKLLIALYIGRTGIASSYGAAGSVVAVLLWIYYSAQIFLFGAEFTSVYADYRASFRRLPDGSMLPSGRGSAARYRTSPPAR
jgi:membrane protein